MDLCDTKIGQGMKFSSVRFIIVYVEKHFSMIIRCLVKKGFIISLLVL